MKADGSISTFNYNDQGQLIEEIQYNANKQKQKEIYWVWLDTLPIAQIEIPFTNNVAGAQTISYLHADHLNTPRWATNIAKQTVWTWQSDAYGTTMANEDPRNTGTKTTVPLRFPGQYFDQETGFHYNYFRTYIPDLGRYSQSDPIGLEGGWNTFVYVQGNPIMWSDKLGLLCFDFDNFANQIRENRFDNVLTRSEHGEWLAGATLIGSLGFGAMPKTPKEIGSLGGKVNQSPYTNQVSRWTGRLNLPKGGRSMMATPKGMFASSLMTAGLVGEGFYNWGTIIYAAWDSTTFTSDCGCK